MKPKRISAKMWENIYHITREAKYDHELNVRNALIAAGAKYGLSVADLEKAQIIEPEEPRQTQGDAHD